jgi:hypothetical protein
MRTVDVDAKLLTSKMFEGYVLSNLFHASGTLNKICPGHVCLGVLNGYLEPKKVLSNIFRSVVVRQSKEYLVTNSEVGEPSYA